MIRSYNLTLSTSKAFSNMQMKGSYAVDKVLTLIHIFLIIHDKNMIKISRIQQFTSFILTLVLKWKP